MQSPANNSCQTGVIGKEPAQSELSHCHLCLPGAGLIWASQRRCLSRTWQNQYPDSPSLAGNGPQPLNMYTCQCVRSTRSEGMHSCTFNLFPPNRQNHLIPNLWPLFYQINAWIKNIQYIQAHIKLNSHYEVGNSLGKVCNFSLKRVRFIYGSPIFGSLAFTQDI